MLRRHITKAHPTKRVYADSTGAQLDLTTFLTQQNAALAAYEEAYALKLLPVQVNDIRGIRDLRLMPLP